MNTANLQLEGLLLAISALVAELKRRGALDPESTEAALQETLQEARSELRTRDELSAANHAAALFPIRFLLAANRLDDGPFAFRDIAAGIGERDVPAA